MALITSVTTELIAGENGIGFFILQAQRSFRAPDMYAGVIALGIVGYILNRGFIALEGLALRWQRDSTDRSRIM